MSKKSDIKVTRKTEYTYEIRLYIGSREGYHGKEFTEEELVEAIGAFQSEYNDYAPVRVTRTRYVDQNYNEGGWEIGAVNYPRKPRTKAQLHRFCTDLAHYLLDTLKIFSPEYNKISDYYVKMVRLDGALTIEQNNRDIKHLSKSTGSEEGIIPLTRDRLKSLGFGDDLIQMVESLSNAA